MPVRTKPAGSKWAKLVRKMTKTTGSSSSCGARSRGTRQTQATGMSSSCRTRLTRAQILARMPVPKVGDIFVSQFKHKFVIVEVGQRKQMKKSKLKSQRHLTRFSWPCMVNIHETESSRPPRAVNIQVFMGSTQARPRLHFRVPARKFGRPVSHKFQDKDMLQSIKALDSVIDVLSKHHGGAALMADPAFKSIAEVIRVQMIKHDPILQGTITPHQRRVVLEAFLQAPGAKFASYQPVSSEIFRCCRTGALEQYNRQVLNGDGSSEIFGILRQMKETFEGNLAVSLEEALAHAKAFEEQKAAKEDAIKAIPKSLSWDAWHERYTQIVKSDETEAKSKEDLEDTQDPKHDPNLCWYLYPNRYGILDGDKRVGFREMAYRVDSW